MTKTARSFVLDLLTSIILLTLAFGALAQVPTELDFIEFSSGIHHRLPGPVIGSDDAVSRINFGTGTASTNLPLGELDQSDIDGYHRNLDGCGPTIYSLETTTEISGTVMRPADVFQADGSKILDAQAAGIAYGVNIDAVSRNPANCELIVSTDIIAELDGVTYSPGDLIEWDAVQGFSLFLAAPLAGNTDAVHIIDTERMLLSLSEDSDTPGSAFQDDDVIERISGTPVSFVLAFAPRTLDPSWEAADLDAVYAVPAPQGGKFRWEIAEIEAFEDDGTVTLTIVRENGSAGAVTVNFSTVDDTATSGADFLGTSGGVSFSDGELQDTVTLTLQDDALVEGTEQLFVDLTGIASGDGTLSTPTRITVAIRDDEDFIFADGFED